MMVGDVAGDKRYFADMIDEVRAKLAHLADDSPIKRCFPKARLDAIGVKIEASSTETLEWGRWQPAFRFLRNSSDAAVQAFDDDLRLVERHSATNDNKLFDFLTSESEDAQPWVGGSFEIYVKATLLRSGEALNASLDWKLPNGRRPDMKIDLGARSICIECTSLGESRASDERWDRHIESMQENRNAVFFERQDAYTQSRRVYAKVFDKIAPRFNVDQGQLNADAPNLLMISMNSVTSDLTARSPAVGWALDELFASQPTGNHSPASLCEWLMLQRKQPERTSSTLEDLLRALAQVSGILVFDGCKLGAARINYNADAAHAISHAEITAVERLLSGPPLYAQ